MRDGENKQSSRKVVRLFQKRWVFPTLYIACAAVILTAALWYQASKDPKQLSQTPSAPYSSQQDDPAVPVTSPSEVVKMPVAEADQVVVKKPFYDDNAEAKVQEEALVFYNNTYTANTGIDLTAKDGAAFDVTAAVSGTVTKAEKDALLGYVVTVDSGNGITTFYQSMSTLNVEEGDTISQGDVLGKAGMSELNKEAGNHLHFEIRKDNVAVNPESFFDKSVSEIKVEEVSTKAKEESTSSEDAAQTEESSTSDDATQTEESTTSDDATQTEESSTSDDATQTEESSTSDDATQSDDSTSSDSDASTQSDSSSSQDEQ